MRQPATIKDVATRAGCGIGTVSRVLNNSGPASANMRQRVLEAAKDLEFEFSEVGRSLQSNHTRTIGVVVPSLVNPVYADAVQGVQEVFQKAGYQTLLACTNYDNDTETNAIRTLIAKQVDGFVLTVSDAAESEGLALIQRREVPHCLLFNMAPDGQSSWSVDDRAAAHMVAYAFSENRHTHIGFLALRLQRSDRARQRFEGFSQGCAEFGMRPPALLELDEGSEHLTGHLRDFLIENPEITGLFASNDFLALSVMRSLRNLGLRVPQDLSIIGFDGIDMGKMVSPTLATIETRPSFLAAGASRTVLSKIDGTAHPEIPDPDHTFVFRSGGSLAPLAAERRDDKTIASTSPSQIRPIQTRKPKQERST